MKKEVTYNIEKLIVKFLTGNLNKEESIQFENWLNADPGNRILFNDYKSAWELTGNYSNSKGKNWEEISKKIDSSYEVPNYITTSVEKPFIKTYFSYWQKIAAAVLIILISSFLVKVIFEKQEDIKLTSYSEPTSTLLPDGSEINLNKGSEITYSKAFNRKTRELNLLGEAFFKVAPNKEKAFIIECSKTTIKVVGTEFNINTDNASNEVIVSVVGGIVEFFPSGSYDKKVILVKGEQGRINYITGKIEKLKIKDLNFIAWKTRELIFDETPLSEAISSIQHLYDTVIVAADTTVQSVKITSTYKNQNLRKVLEEIHLLTGIDYYIKNDTIFLK